MVYAIAKEAMFDCQYFVTAIKRGGLTMDNVRFDPNDRHDCRWQARKWKNIAAAEKALASLHIVGGFDDYAIVELAA